jgi:molecular chaperone GrpE
MTKKIKETKLKEEIKDLENKFRRTLADYQNQDKRHKSRQVEIVKFANQSLLDKLLPVLDSLELAQHHLKDAGLKMVLDQFTKTINLEGVEEIPSTNKKFDPETMDCANLVSGPKNLVVRTLVKGYTYYNKILRPAKVEVGSGSNRNPKA